MKDDGSEVKSEVSTGTSLASSRASSLHNCATAQRLAAHPMPKLLKPDGAKH
jgi:hypothetical protein